MNLKIERIKSNHYLFQSFISSGVFKYSYATPAKLSNYIIRCKRKQINLYFYPLRKPNSR